VIEKELLQEFSDNEFSVIESIMFDFEFDTPFTYIAIFKSRYYDILTQLVDFRKHEVLKLQFAYFIELAQKYAIDSYLRPNCLFYPVPIIAAACLLLSAKMYNI
jgi:hypothetical protein